MKKNMYDKILVRIPSANFLFSVSFGMLLLQSCCTAHEGSTASCRLQKPEGYVFNETKLRPSVAEPAVVGSGAAYSINQSKIDMPEVKENTSATPDLIPVAAKAVKKLPLGIQSVGTTIVAGPNISFFTNKATTGGSMKRKSKPGIGFQAGVGLNLEFNDKFSVDPSLLLKHNAAGEDISYTYTGGGGEPGTNYSDNYSFTWISVPILANIKMGDNLSFFAGPEVNFLLSAKVDSDGEKTDLKDNAVKTGIGAQLGARYTFPGSGAWGLQLLYDHRISRLNKSEYSYGGGSGYSVPGWYMKGFQVSVTCAICNLLHGKG